MENGPEKMENGAEEIENGVKKMATNNDVTRQRFGEILEAMRKKHEENQVILLNRTEKKIELLKNHLAEAIAEKENLEKCIAASEQNRTTM